MPRACASSTMRATGFTVPSALETWMTDTNFVRSPSAASYAAMSSSPASVMGTTRSLAPVCSHTSCHGTMLEWCSIQVSTTSSPGRRLVRPQLCATRLMPVGAAAREDDFAGLPGVDELLDAVPGALVGLRRALAQQVRRAVDVGVVVLVVPAIRVDHRLRLLRGVRVVQVDQRLPVHRLREDRELRPDGGGVDGAGRPGGRRHHASAAFGSAASRASSSASRSGSIVTRSMMSLANA